MAGCRFFLQGSGSGGVCAPGRDDLPGERGGKDDDADQVGQAAATPKMPTRDVRTTETTCTAVVLTNSMAGFIAKM